MSSEWFVSSGITGKTRTVCRFALMADGFSKPSYLRNDKGGVKYFNSPEAAQKAADKANAKLTKMSVAPIGTSA